MKYQRKILFWIANKFFRSHHKIFWILAAFVLSILCGTTTDYESIDLYLQKIQSLSEHQLTPQQKSYIVQFYLSNPDMHPNSRKRHKIRDDFNKRKSHLKQEWSNVYKITWPTQLTIRYGSIKKVDFDAHHIVPINAGGVNKWWNITPLESKNHTSIHNSTEEQACFSHDPLFKKFARFILKLRILLQKTTHQIPPRLIPSV